MKNVAMSGMDPFNYGDRAVIAGTIQSLKAMIPDVSLTMYSPVPEINREIYQDYDVKVTKSPWCVRPLKPKLRTITNMYCVLLSIITLVNCLIYRLLKPLKIKVPVRGRLNEHDLLIELGTDTHASYFGPLAFFYSLFFPLFCILLNKPFVMFGETLGPYKNNIYKTIMRYLCNKASLITLREAASLSHMNDLRLNHKNVYVTAEPAFLFNSQCSAERLQNILSAEGIENSNIPLVGIAPSALIFRYTFPEIKSFSEKRHKYITFMAKMTDYIVENFGCNALLIAHVLSPEWSDKPVCEEILQRVKNKKRVFMLNNDYSVDDVKAIIGSCQMFLTCKMHVAIAATSVNVPTVAMAFSHKYEALTPILDPEKYVVDVRYHNFDELTTTLSSKIDYVWNNRKSVVKALQEQIPDIKEKALLGVKLTADLIK